MIIFLSRKNRICECEIFLDCSQPELNVSSFIECFQLVGFFKEFHSFSDEYLVYPQIV